MASLWSCLVDSPAYREQVEAMEQGLGETGAWLDAFETEVAAMKDAIAVLAQSQQRLSEVISSAKNDVLTANTCEFVTKFMDEFRANHEHFIDQLECGVLLSVQKIREDQIIPIKPDKRAFVKASERYYHQYDKFMSIPARKRDQSNYQAMLKDAYNERLEWLNTSLTFWKKLTHSYDRRDLMVADQVMSLMLTIKAFEARNANTLQALDVFLTKFGPHLDKVAEFLTAQDVDHAELVDEILEGTTECVKHVEKTGSVPSSARFDIWDVQHVIADADGDAVAGFLMMQKRGKMAAAFGGTWVRTFCQYESTSGTFSALSVGQTEAETFKVDSCVQKYSEDTDRPFCFELGSKDKVYVFQAPSGGARRTWISSMGGLQPVKTMKRRKRGPASPDLRNSSCTLNPATVSFLQKLMARVERDGLDTQGIYRLSGQHGRVAKLYSDGVIKGRQVNLQNEDVMTCTSTVKHIFRKLAEPLFTFDFHDELIDAIGETNEEERFANVTSILAALPVQNLSVADILFRHLSKIAGHADENRMQASNLGLVFGPTLLRSEDADDAAALANLEQRNTLVAWMINNYEQLFQEAKRLQALLLKEAGSEEQVLVDADDLAPSSGAASPRLQRAAATLAKSAQMSDSAAGETSSLLRKQPTRRRPDHFTLAMSTTGSTEGKSSLVQALYDCAADDDGELTFRAGDTFCDVKPSEEPGWLHAKLLRTGESGLIPENYVVRLNTSSA